MKKFLLLSACLFLFSNQYAQTDTLARSLKQLNVVLQQAPDFDQKKQAGLDSLKQLLAAVNNNDLPVLFRAYENLYSSYKVFQYDSSYTYAKKMLAVALRLNDASLINYARIKMGFSLLSSGMYKETLDSLS
ncbi:MAG TPA: tetratricopeptide repeat protein, partial [Niastella sp.]